MFGGLRVSCGERALTEGDQRISKPLELLVLLVLNRGNKISNEQLMEALWEPDELENPAGALKNAAYSLRNSLQGLCPGAALVVTRERQYCWNTEAPMELDVERFAKLYYQAAKDGQEDERLELCRAALALYTGDFLPGLGDRHWVIPRASALRQQYLDLTITADTALTYSAHYETLEKRLAALGLC